jgi:D-glycero-D-manno-heptose 1,7-bisphosphate phosphatase
VSSDERLKAPCVFLDRDGVLNKVRVVDGNPHPPRSASELEIIPSSVNACRRLRAAGYLLVVVSNQPDVARGTDTLAGVNALNDVVGSSVDVNEFVVCPHDDADGCNCRKPAPGMLTAAAGRLNIDLRRSFMVGDRWRDVEAGQLAGCRTVFVDRGYAERKPEAPDLVVGELVEALPFLIAAIDQAQEGSKLHA